MEKYGTPQAVSPNGRLFIFRPKKSSVVNILYITLDSFKFLKSFDIFESIENYKSELERSEVTDAAEFISVLNEKYQSHT